MQVLTYPFDSSEILKNRKSKNNCYKKTEQELKKTLQY